MFGRDIYVLRIVRIFRLATSCTGAAAPRNHIGAAPIMLFSVTPGGLLLASCAPMFLRGLLLVAAMLIPVTRRLRFGGALAPYVDGERDCQAHRSQKPSDPRA